MMCISQGIYLAVFLNARVVIFSGISVFICGEVSRTGINYCLRKIHMIRFDAGNEFDPHIIFYIIHYKGLELIILSFLKKSTRKF